MYPAPALDTSIQSFFGGVFGVLKVGRNILAGFTGRENWLIALFLVLLVLLVLRGEGKRGGGQPGREKEGAERQEEGENERKEREKEGE